jgi:hypothetical protein
MRGLTCVLALGSLLGYAQPASTQCANGQCAAGGNYSYVMLPAPFQYSYLPSPAVFETQKQAVPSASVVLPTMAAAAPCCPGCPCAQGVQSERYGYQQPVVMTGAYAGTGSCGSSAEGVMVRGPIRRIIHRIRNR